MKKPSSPQAVKRVLVIRVGHLGDSILATAIIEPLRAAYGDNVSIDFAAGTGVSSVILEMDARINRVFPINRRRVHWRFNSLKKDLRSHSRKEPYDVVINLECGDECNDFSRFLACGQFHGQPFTHREHSLDRHCVDTEKSIYRDLLGNEITDAAEPAIQTGPGVMARADGTSEAFVLINPGFAGIAETGYRTHRGWPVKHWAGLVRLVTGQAGMKIYVNGTTAELPFLLPLLDMPGVRSLVGSSIEELVGAVQSAQCVISVDTGTMHLGTALGTPVVALFGPTIPALTGPYSRTVPCKVLTSGVDCQPCDRTPLQKRCTFNRCMSELAPQTVFAALQELLAAPGSQGDSTT